MKPKYSKGDLVLAKLAGDAKYEIYEILDDGQIDFKQVVIYRLPKRDTHPSMIRWGRNTITHSAFNYMYIAEYVLFPFASLGF